MSAVEQTRQGPQDDSERPDFDRSDVPPRAVVYGVVTLFAGIAISAGFVAGLLAIFDNYRNHIAFTPVETAPLSTSAPRLEISPETDRAEIEAAARAKLQGYGWTDRDAGRAHIPIDRAMELLAKQGWPHEQYPEGPRS
jgi:hypothetical protein